MNTSQQLKFDRIPMRATFFSDLNSLRTPVIKRAGVSLLEILFVIAMISFLLVLAMPQLLEMRERSRRTTCQQRLRTLTLSLNQYHDVHSIFPPAAVWDTHVTESLALHRSRRIDRITRENWAILLLPFFSAGDSSALPAFSGSIGDSQNSALRQARVPTMTCPTDHFNNGRNRYQLATGSADEVISFSRGNYAVNGGSHHYESEPPTTMAPHGDHLHLHIDDAQRQFAMWGNGIAGINRSFHRDEIVNGQGTLIAIEELRAGVHSLDPRGVWALGQIGGSLTWAHGVNGDAAGPNNNWVRADDLLGCRQLHQAVGSDRLHRLNMPCVDYVDANQQATSRSLHPGGVHAAFVDGSVRFLSDRIDLSVWHVIHSRETPSARLGDSLDQLLATMESRASHKNANVGHTEFVNQHSAMETELLTNSLGMTFAKIPPGTFTMGFPDQKYLTAMPSEAPAHAVQISVAFWMGTHEVTRDLFVEVMGESALPTWPADSENDKAPDSESTQLASLQLPVTGLSWDAAEAFCRALSDHWEEQAAGRSYRLPSEAEWEYACRSGEAQPYHLRPRRRPGDESGFAAGISPPLSLNAVGSYPANSWGLFDMRGNAWEWTSDWYARDHYSRAMVINPSGPPAGFLKVVRGSDWRFAGEDCHIDAAVLPPWKGNPMVGFRVVCENRKR